MSNICTKHLDLHPFFKGCPFSPIFLIEQGSFLFSVLAELTFSPTVIFYLNLIPFFPSFTISCSVFLHLCVISSIFLSFIPPGFSAVLSSGVRGTRKIGHIHLENTLPV